MAVLRWYMWRRRIYHFGSLCSVIIDYPPSQITENGTVVSFNALSVIWDDEDKKYDARLISNLKILSTAWYCDDPSDVYNVANILDRGESPTDHDE